jgi:glyceraldehyde 3-phosphate dehydrogenase
MTIRIAVNGFGRTGRAAVRAAFEHHRHDVEIVAVNDLAEPAALARLLARDSVHGPFPGEVHVEGDIVHAAGRPIRFLAEAEASALPWKQLAIDVVIESTGRFTTREKAAAHLAAGAGRVIVSAPAKGVDATFVLGVNEQSFDPARHFVVSNASCTTNCLALMAKVLDEAVGIEQALMSTIHAYTGDQRLTDALHKDLRRSRAAALNIVPTTTGAAKATEEVLPELAGHFGGGLSLRVPVPDGSITDLVATMVAPASVEAINEAFKVAADGVLKGLLEYSEEPLVSTDIVGNSASCIFDSQLTIVSGRLVKILGWYDNETGYSSRLVDLAAIVGAAR